MERADSPRQKQESDLELLATNLSNPQYERENEEHRIEAVLFDLFDTLLLVESEENHFSPSLKKLVESLNKDGIPVSLKDFEGKFIKVMERIYNETSHSLEEPHFRVHVSETLKALGYELDALQPIVQKATKSFGDEFKRYVHLDPHAPATLRRLHSRYKLGLVSNLAISEIGWELLQEHGLGGYFETIVISGDVNKRKPNKEIFKQALRTLGVQAEKAAFVGDSLDADIMGAQKVGMKTVHIKRRPVQYSEVHPNASIKTLSELVPALSKLEISSSK